MKLKKPDILVAGMMLIGIQSARAYVLNPNPWVGDPLAVLASSSVTVSPESDNSTNSLRPVYRSTSAVIQPQTYFESLKNGICSAARSPVECTTIAMAGNRDFNTGATASNDSTGLSKLSNGSPQVEPIVPAADVPEPITNFLVGGGLIGLYILIRRRRPRIF